MIVYANGYLYSHMIPDMVVLYIAQNTMMAAELPSDAAVVMSSPKCPTLLTNLLYMSYLCS